MQGKLKKVLVVGLSLCFLVSACSKGEAEQVKNKEKADVSEEVAKKQTKIDLEKVTFDMPVAELTATIGEPKAIITDTKQIEKVMQKEMKNLMIVVLKNKDRIVDFFGGEEKLAELQDRLTDVSKLSMYQYGDKQNVYVYEDKVIFRSF